MKRVAILGSTGSIGKQTLEVLKTLPDYEVVALAADSNIELLEHQAALFRPKYIAVFNDQAAHALQKRLPHFQILKGEEGGCIVASLQEVDLVVSAISGTRGIVPSFAAAKAGKQIALANKEVLVSAGQLFIEAIKANNGQIIPVDSEHSAIFQCLQGHAHTPIHRLILTASGGPFRLFSQKQLEEVTVKQALAHPTWSMGRKITIDSSTLMNKGLEVIEAYWLFNVPYHKIEVVVHPQSIVHGGVEFEDGVLLMQMGNPSMMIPIRYALTYPTRSPSVPYAAFDFFKSSPLDFFPPDRQKFPCLDLAYRALEIGGSAPCYLNAANEVLVHRFLKGDIGWGTIAHRLTYLLDQHSVQPLKTLETVLEIDAQGRKEAAQ